MRKLLLIGGATAFVASFALPAQAQCLCGVSAYSVPMYPVPAHEYSTRSAIQNVRFVSTYRTVVDCVTGIRYVVHGAPIAVAYIY